jgi:hypothetical protein
LNHKETTLTFKKEDILILGIDLLPKRRFAQLKLRDQAVLVLKRFAFFNQNDNDIDNDLHFLHLFNEQ